MSASSRSRNRLLKEAVQAPSTQESVWIQSGFLVTILVAYWVWATPPPAFAGGGAVVKNDTAAWAVIVNAENPVKRLDLRTLKRIFLGRKRKWEGDGRVRVFQTSFGSKSRAYLNRMILEMSPERVKEYWLEERIRGNASVPKTLRTDRAVLAFVAVEKGGIGIVPRALVSGKKVRVVAVFPESREERTSR